MAKSCAIVVRVFDGEAPYLQSFIDHHRSIGIEQFYPVIAPGGAPLCREILSRNKLNFTEVEGQKIGAVRGLIKEDYVAVIDADEYCILISSHSFKRRNFSRWPCLGE